ncbi:MAG TPA: hypothetical protein VLC51_07705 [Nitrospira sp.]|nr:hypothetical protein [Nitrospira sp.]
MAPVITDLNAAGGEDDYGKAPKGNLDITGRYFIWTTNIYSPHLEAFVVKVPSEVLFGLAPVPPPTSPTSPVKGKKKPR